MGFMEGEACAGTAKWVQNSQWRCTHVGKRRGHKLKWGAVRKAKWPLVVTWTRSLSYYQGWFCLSHRISLQFVTPSHSHAGASPLDLPHSLSCHRPPLSVHKPRVSHTGFLLFLDFLTLEDGTNTLSRNIGKGLPLNAALYHRRAQISVTELLKCM
jgi:hypothetical protein